MKISTILKIVVASTFILAAFPQMPIGNGTVVPGGGGGTITGSCATTGGVFYQSGVVNEATCSSAFTWNATTGLALTKPITITQGSLTGASTPAWSSTATWNNAATTFVHDDVNITNTASAAGSLLMQRQVDGVSIFSLSRSGTFTIGNSAGLSNYTITGAGEQIQKQVGNEVVYAYYPNYDFASAFALRWSSDGTYFGAKDLGIKRSSAGVVEVNNGTAGTYRDITFRSAQWRNDAESTCNSSTRGKVTMVQGGAGVADTFRQCEKDASDVYAWVPLNGSGSGATALAGMTDFGMVKTSSTVATINGSASSSAPVNARIGSTVYSFTGAGTVTLSGTACSATQYWYVASDGTLTMGHNASTCTYTGSGVTVATPISAYPANSIPLWTTSTTTGAWDTIAGAMDKRAPNSKDRNFIQGDGITLTETASGITIANSQADYDPISMTTFNNVFQFITWGSGYTGAGVTTDWTFNGSCGGAGVLYSPTAVDSAGLGLANANCYAYFQKYWGDIISGATPKGWTYKFRGGRYNAGSGDIYIGASGSISNANNGAFIRYNNGAANYVCVIRSGGSDVGTPTTITGATVDLLPHTYVVRNQGAANIAYCSIDGGTEVSTSGTIPSVSLTTFSVGTATASTQFLNIQANVQITGLSR